MSDYILHTFSLWKLLIKKNFNKLRSYLSDIDFKDFINIYNKCTVEPYSFLVSDPTLPTNNPLRFRKILFK